MGVGHLAVPTGRPATGLLGGPEYAWRLYLRAGVHDGGSGAPVEVSPKDMAQIIRKVQFTFPPGTPWRNADVHDAPFESSVVGGSEAQSDVRVRVSFRKAVPHPPVVIEHCIDICPANGAEKNSWEAALASGHLRSLDVTASADKFLRLGLLPERGGGDGGSASSGSDGEETVRPGAAGENGRGDVPAPGRGAEAGGGPGELTRSPTASVPAEGGGVRGEAEPDAGSSEVPGRPASAEVASGAPKGGGIFIGVRTNWEIDYGSITFAIPKVRMGSGGYGEVFKAKWNGITVAVKELLDKNPSDEQIREFKQEVATLSHLRHPSIVLWMGCVLQPPNLAIVMEFCAGGSLARLLHNSRSSSPPQPSLRLKWAVSIAEGMKYLHSIDMIHRDLNSNNVLVDKRGQAKVCDFGLARVRMSTQCRTSRGRGTTYYSAPEVIRCEPHSESCDVFSFGVLLWELSVLRRPWEGYSDYQVMFQVTERGGRPKIPEALDADLVALISACWADDPQARPDFDGILSMLKGLPPSTSMLAEPLPQDPR